MKVRYSAALMKREEMFERFQQETIAGDLECYERRAA